MLELHIRKFLGDLKDGIHVAERSRKDELVALLSKVAKHALGVGAGENVFHRRDLDLVAEFLLEFLTGEVMLAGPAFFARGAHVDEGNLEGALSRLCRLRSIRSLRGLRGLGLVAAG